MESRNKGTRTRIIEPRSLQFCAPVSTVLGLAGAPAWNLRAAQLVQWQGDRQRRRV